jgi:hypothetical protein
MSGFTENSRLSNERMLGNNVKLFEALKGIIAVDDGKRECVELELVPVLMNKPKFPSTNTPRLI